MRRSVHKLMTERYTFSPEAHHHGNVALTDHEIKTLGELGLTPDNLDALLHGQPFAEGSYALIFEHVTSDPHIMAKVWKNPMHDSGRAKNEHIALRLLRMRAQENTPTLRSFFKSPPILLENKIEGESLEHCDKETLNHLAVALANLHSIRFNKYGKNLTERKRGTRMDFLLEGIETLRTSLADFPKKTETTSVIRRSFDKMTGDAGRSSDAFSDRNFMLIHFDLNPGNVLYSETNHTIILIDWEQASVGDAAMDLAKLFLKFSFSEEQRQAFLARYESALREKDPSLRERLRVYELFVLTNSLLWRMRVLKDMPKQVASENERQFYDRVSSRFDEEINRLKRFLSA